MPEPRGSATTAPPQLAPEHREVVAALGRALREAGFGQARVNGVLGAPADAVPRRRPPVLVLQRRRLDHGQPLHVLIDCFVLGGTMPVALLQEAVPGVDVGDLVAGGLLEFDEADDSVRASLSIVPCGDVLVAADFHTIGDASLEHVPAVTSSSVTVLHAASRGPVRRLLDIGTGAGLLALGCGRGAQEVVATDVNARALGYVQVGAALNDLTNIDVREGSLFEPVDGELFDHIVCNPPFVISPGAGSLYEHSGLPGDTVSRRLVRGAADHLEEGGRAVFMCNWAHPEGDWLATVTDWAQGTGCDVLVVLLGSEPAVQYIEDWHPGAGGAPVPGETVEDWLRYFDGLGIEHVAGGIVCLRRRTTGHANWVQHVTGAPPTTDRLGELLERSFAGIDRLMGLPSPGSLLELAFRRVEGCVADEKLATVDGQQVMVGARIGWPAGGGVTLAADPLAIVTWDALDGVTPLAQVAARISEQTSLDLTDVALGAVTFVQRALVSGMVELPQATQ